MEKKWLNDDHRISLIACHVRANRLAILLDGVPVKASKKSKRHPSGTQLTRNAQIKGGSRPKYNRGLQEAMNHIVRELDEDGVPATFPTVWNWMLENALDAKRYEFQPTISGCDMLYVADGMLHFQDQLGTEYYKAKTTLRRYFTRARQSQAENK